MQARAAKPSATVKPTVTTSNVAPSNGLKKKAESSDSESDDSSEDESDSDSDVKKVSLIFLLDEVTMLYFLKLSSWSLRFWQLSSYSLAFFIF